MKRLLAVAALLVVAALIALAPAAPTAAQTQVVCTWANVGSNTQDLFHVASAFDYEENAAYVYGGVGSDYSVQNTVETTDLSAASLSARWRSAGVSGAKKLVGVSGAFRGKGKGSAESAAYFFGGMNDPQTGNATNDVQRLVVKTGAWEQVNAANATEFKARIFGAAAYDPDHDAIWVVGGISNCALPDVIGGGNCPARPLSTNYLTWDAQGNATWNTLANGNQSIYAHSMVYDAARKRMLIYGGTSNITRGTGDVLALDLSDADASKAKFVNVATTGSGPSTYFHGGAAMVDLNWMVVYGGVRQGFMQASESVEGKTYALDLSVNPARWSDVGPTGNPSTRVGGFMEYDPLHKAGIFGLGRDKSDGNPATVERIMRTTYALTCQVVTITPTTPPTVRPTNTPGGGGPNPTVPPPPTAEPNPRVCDFIRSRVPGPVISAALANPASVSGNGLLCNPKLPQSNWNVKREFLSLEIGSKPFHPLYNSVIWKCGCP